VILSALLLGSVLGQSPGLKITGETKYKPHSLVRLKAEGADPKAGLIWRIYPRTGVARATTPKGVLEFTAPPGTYEVEVIAITKSGADEFETPEAWATVVIESCHPPEPKPDPKPDPNPNPPRPNPPSGTLDPENAIGRIQFGNAGCSATVIGPRRPDGRWDVLTAAHCMGGVGQVGRMVMPKTGKVYNVRVVAHNKTCDLAWMVTEESITDIEYANLAPANPPLRTPVWHRGYGYHLPRNKETGEVTGGETNSGQLRFYLNVSSGDSGGGIFRADTNEVVSAVCCTAGIAQKTSMWGGSTAQAHRLRPKHTSDVSDEWVPIAIPQRDDPEAETKQIDEKDWVPVEIPVRKDEEAPPQTEYRVVPTIPHYGIPLSHGPIIVR
jgi:hypothetical protein